MSHTLGRTWQYDVNATHRGKRYIYMFIGESKWIAMKFTPPVPKLVKKEKSKFISYATDVSS